MVALNRSWDWSPLVDPIVIRLSDVRGDIEQTAKMEVVLERAAEEIIAIQVEKVNANVKRCTFRVEDVHHIRTRKGGELCDTVTIEMRVCGTKASLIEGHHLIRQEVDAAPRSNAKSPVEEGATQRRIKALPPEQQDMQLV